MIKPLIPLGFILTCRKVLDITFAVMQNETINQERKNYGGYLKPTGFNQTNAKIQIVAIPIRVQARLDAAQTALILGFTEHDIPILVAAKLLLPLGKPVPNATKYFATCDIEVLATNKQWLEDATQALYDYWKGKNERKVSAQKAAKVEIPLAA